MSPGTKKQPYSRFFLPAVILLCIGILMLSVLIKSPREKMQEDLAKEFGVRIQDYPYPSSFPSGYFSDILKPGMTVSEVHDIVSGYEKVVNCQNSSEVYYYFSAELEDAKRFKLSYQDGVYSRFEGEEDDSRTLRTDGCMPGLIKE